MFGINNKYLLDFSVNGKRDFIQTVEFQSFELTEEAGNNLPSFKLIFLSADDSLKSYVNEGTVLRATFGKDYNSLHNIELVIALSDVSAAADGKRLFTLQGVQNKLKYVNIPRIRHSKKESAFEVMKKVASEHFSVNARPAESLDEQVWIQSSMTDRNFINQLWLHSDHGDGFPMIGICSLNNEFRMRNSTELFGSGPQWYFAPDGGFSGNRIYYEAGYQVRNASSFFNAMKGYGRPSFNIDREGGEVKSFTPTTRPGLAPGGRLNQAPGLNTGTGTITPATENMHSKFYEAHAKNTQALMVYSSFRVQLHFRDVFIPVKVLDLAMFIETFGVNKQVDEYSSGLYIVTKVTRMFSGQQFATYVTLSREAPGGMA